MNRQRVILDAAIDRGVIRGTLTASSGEPREFHGWLVLNTALEAALDTLTDRVPSDHSAASAAVPANARDPQSALPVTQSVNPPSGRSGTRAARPAR